jgi:tetratricopeptide (TPR) repeat protein
LLKQSAIAAVLVLSLVASLPAQDKKKEWKDRGEYDLYDSIAKTQDPTQWLATLDKWKQQYPQSDYADVRRQLTLETYRALAKPREAFDAAQDVLKDNPNNLVALSVTVGNVYALVPFGANPLTAQQQSDLDVTEKAAQQILSNLDSIYSKENRPPAMADDQANQAKPQLKAFAQKTLGYIALERKDYKVAQTELTKALQADPNQGQVSFWLATAMLAQNQTRPELQPSALYEFARAAAFDGTGALPAPDRQQVQEYLNKVYTQYHGSADGLDRLVAASRNNPLPAAGFQIKSKAEVEREKIEAEDAAARANPMLALWRRIKTELQSDQGSTYFENNMKGAALPGGVNGIAKFKGKLVSMTPAVRPKELVLAIENSNTADVTLKLDSALPGKMEPGAAIEFDGIADSYTREPFMVTFNVEKSHIAGWSGGGAPPARRHTAAKKTGAN